MAFSGSNEIRFESDRYVESRSNGTEDPSCLDKITVDLDAFDRLSFKIEKQTAE